MILVIDGSLDECTKIKKEILSAYPDSEVKTVTSADEAMDLLNKETVDVCFMNPVLKKNSSVTIIDKLRRIKKDVKINFVADSAEYAMMAWQLHVNDYLLRPITRDSVLHAKRKAEGLVG